MGIEQIILRWEKVARTEPRPQAHPIASVARPSAGAVERSLFAKTCSLAVSSALWVLSFVLGRGNISQVPALSFGRSLVAS